jgi:hypothetical protein
MNHNDRLAMQEAYKAKFARRDNESVAFWRARLDYANLDINVCLRQFKADASYCERLYIELDACRDAQLRASRAA